MSEEEKQSIADATSLEVVCDVTERHITRVKTLKNRWEEKKDVYIAKLKNDPDNKELQNRVKISEKEVAELDDQLRKLQAGYNVMDCI